MPLETPNKLETVDRNEALDYFQQKGFLPKVDKDVSHLDTSDSNSFLKTMFEVTGKEKGFISNEKGKLGYFDGVAFAEKSAYESKSMACEWVRENSDVKLLLTYVDEDQSRRQRSKFLTCLFSFDKGNQFTVEILPGYMVKYQEDLEKFKVDEFLPFLEEFCNKVNQKENLVEISKENMQEQSSQIRYDYAYVNSGDVPASQELKAVLKIYTKPIITKEKFDSLTDISQQLSTAVKEFKKNDNYQDNWEIRDKASQKIQELVSHIEKNKYSREEVKNALIDIDECLDKLKKHQPSWQERGLIQMFKDVLRTIFSLGAEKSYKDKYMAVVTEAKLTVSGLNNNSGEIKDKEKQNSEELPLPSSSPKLYS